MTRSVLIALLLITIPTVGLSDSNVNQTNRYAYAANVGWIDYAAEITNGAVVGEYVCSNYVHGANVGWIHMGAGTPTNGIRYANVSAADYGVNLISPNKLRGYAYGANIGWVNFEDDGDPRIDLETGHLEGYAYSANMGWISLSNLQATVQMENVQPGLDSDVDGITDAWELTYTNTIGTFDGATDSDLDGALDINEYLAGTDPTDTGSLFRIVAIANVDATNTMLRWSSETSRLYRIQMVVSLTNVPNWVDSGLGLQHAGASNETSKLLYGDMGTQRFYRVRAVRPLSPTS
ncbi:MAG: hypothetical protein HN919_15875 [Verrucomicrobia bacterium]|jgi:hypothetical protein|nr:hypothetical protein [Verrucomicrobiota bacterium]